MSSPVNTFQDLMEEQTLHEILSRVHYQLLLQEEQLADYERYADQLVHHMDSLHERLRALREGVPAATQMEEAEAATADNHENNGSDLPAAEGSAAEPLTELMKNTNPAPVSVGRVSFLDAALPPSALQTMLQGLPPPSVERPAISTSVGAEAAHPPTSSAHLPSSSALKTTHSSSSADYCGQVGVPSTWQPNEVAHLNHEEMGRLRTTFPDYLLHLVRSLEWDTETRASVSQVAIFIEEKLRHSSNFLNRILSEARRIPWREAGRAVADGVEAVAALLSLLNPTVLALLGIAELSYPATSCTTVDAGKGLTSHRLEWAASWARRLFLLLCEVLEGLRHFWAVFEPAVERLLYHSLHGAVQRMGTASCGYEHDLWSQLDLLHIVGDICRSCQHCDLAALLRGRLTEIALRQSAFDAPACRSHLGHLLHLRGHGEVLRLMELLCASPRPWASSSALLPQVRPIPDSDVEEQVQFLRTIL